MSVVRLDRSQLYSAMPNDTQPTALVHLSEWVGPTAMGMPVVSGGTGGPIATANLVVGDGAALVFAAAATHGAPLGGPTNGFVALDPLGLNDTRLAAAYQLSPSAGTYATNWSYAAPDSWDAVVMSFVQ